MMYEYLLFAAGLLVFAAAGPGGLVILVLLCLLCYVAGRAVPRHPWVLYVGIAGIAAAFFLMRTLQQPQITALAPLGFSYAALRLISYLADIRSGKQVPERSFFRFLLCMTYFPAAFLGPVERYGNLSAAIFQQRQISWERFSGGLGRIVWGLFKKLCIAARAAVIVGTVSAAPQQYRGGYIALAAVLYSVQLYADFSGGMDLVLGFSQMLGIRLSENFRAPFFSESVPEFWRKWHITLGTWIRDYIYIPLGGSRKGALRRVLHLLAAFLVSGLWHGRQYLLWGLVNGILVAVGDRLKTGCRRVNQLMTFLLISFSWIFFLWPNASGSLAALSALFAPWEAVDLLTLGLELSDWVVMLLSAAAVVLYDRSPQPWAQRFRNWKGAGKTAAICLLALVVLVFGMYGIGFEVDAFVYSRF